MIWSQVTYRLSVSPKSFWKWFPFSRSGQEDLLSCAFAIQRLDQSEHSQEYQSKQRGEIAAVAAPGAAVFLGDFIWSSSVHRPELSLVGVYSWLMGTEIRWGVQSPPTSRFGGWAYKQGETSISVLCAPMCPMWLCTKYKVENHFSRLWRQSHQRRAWTRT